MLGDKHKLSKPKWTRAPETPPQLADEDEEEFSGSSWARAAGSPPHLIDEHEKFSKADQIGREQAEYHSSQRGILDRPYWESSSGSPVLSFARQQSPAIDGFLHSPTVGTVNFELEDVCEVLETSLGFRGQVMWKYDSRASKVRENKERSLFV